MCRLYGKFASYLGRVLCKTRLIFPRINGPNVATLCCAKTRRCESYSCNITLKVSRNVPVTVRDSGLFEGLLACPILFGSINNTLNVTVYIEEDGNLSQICHTQWKPLNTTKSES